MRWPWDKRAPTEEDPPPKTDAEREEQTYRSIETGLDVASEGVRTARDAVRQARAARRQAAGPFVEEAFPEGPRR